MSGPAGTLRIEPTAPDAAILDGRQRVIIEGVTPEIDGGRFPIKRTTGQQVAVKAVIFLDGHDHLSAVVRYRSGTEPWQESPLKPFPEDVWKGEFSVGQPGITEYTFEAWADSFGTWRADLRKKFDARQDLTVDWMAGALMLEAAAKRASGKSAEQLLDLARGFRGEPALPEAAKMALAESEHLRELMWQHAERTHLARYEKTLRVLVEPPLARFSAWYELFPRSMSPEPGRHGTFRDIMALLPRIAEMGFDILYLPPIHPIGRTHRKGRNGALVAGPEDPGSPWAIGSAEGGHKSIHPELGTEADFRSLVTEARSKGIEVALDIAFQCSPDHPYVREHPEWFRKRPDGTIQYAENPPKKYQDIYPFDFETPEWRALWAELRSIFTHWMDQGVRVFRVDNPHTKSFRFWEWCIGGLKHDHPELVFLSEAFTRRPVMYYLAKLGFTQSYNYFPWRNTKRELMEYLTELTRAPLREYFRPSLWPNTPHILTETLQYGGRATFMSRLVLAATLGASYGIYGPAFEQCDSLPRDPGSEEYLDSEKYQLRSWDWNAPHSLAGLASRLNAIRRENPALQSDWSLEFHPVDNEYLIAYSKHDPATANRILVVVNLDPHHVQRGWIELPLEEWKAVSPFQVHDLLTGARYLWSGPRNFVELSPRLSPAHIFRFRQFVRNERNFDYFL